MSPKPITTRDDLIASVAFIRSALTVEHERIQAGLAPDNFNAEIRRDLVCVELNFLKARKALQDAESFASGDSSPRPKPAAIVEGGGA